jgi:NOL1/NOP2/fmu family ribosome biogenesis protein
VYSTCTFAPEENEQTVAAFLADHPDFTPEAVAAPWFTPCGPGCFRLWPHKLLGEGHFAAVLRRAGEAQREEPRQQPGEKLPKEWTEFAKAMDITLPGGKAVTFGQSLYWSPEGMPALAGLHLERPGLELGVVKKGRFEPAHALALWLGSCKVQQDLAAGSRELEAYLHGDVVPSRQKGWCLVTADGYSIGWGKGDGTVLKNHYPKGLRR